MNIPMGAGIVSQEANELQDEINDLRAKLRSAHIKLNEFSESAPTSQSLQYSPTLETQNGKLPQSPHFLLLLADSALPLGSFAFSSGLESYLAHNKRASFSNFLSLSISSHASATLPFLLAAYHNPQDLLHIDDSLDAAIMCTVGRRASVAQGRALLSIWERAFRSSFTEDSDIATLQVLKDFSAALKASNANDEVPAASAHLAPLFGAVARVSMIGKRDMAYMYMLSHVKALLSAAVRAGVFGPYQSQKLLASKEVQEQIEIAIEKDWETKIEDAGQYVPVMDLWIGRHELLYSRIFNS